MKVKIELEALMADGAGSDGPVGPPRPENGARSGRAAHRLTRTAHPERACP